MNAEIVAIGDELTSGERLDTNSQWLSRQLEAMGIRVLYHSTVGDTLEAMEQVLRLALERAEVVVCTGGLGPTADDLTRQALANVTGTELVLDEEALRHIQALFRSRRRDMPDRNVVQAMFPACSTPIPNPHGTAPGIELTNRRTGRPPSRLFALPGVPAEMYEMFHETVASKIASLQDGPASRIRHHCVKCFGAGESELEQMLPDLIRRGREPKVGITASKATITLRVTARGGSDDACWAAMQPTLATIRECLGDLIFGENEDELQDAVSAKFVENQWTLATAECVSGGLLSRWLNETSRAATFYRGGVVLPSDAPTVDSAASHLNEATGLETQTGAGELAERVRREFGVDYALVLGRLDPDSPPRSARAPVAVAAAHGVHLDWAPYSGHPDILQARCTKHALNVLRKLLPSAKG